MNSQSLTEAQCLKIMDTFLDKQNDPEVGIFWYDPREDELFGVVSIAPLKGLNTINKLHKQVWAKERNRRIGKKQPLGQWSGDYKDTPRGRVFKADDGYLVKVGSWIYDYPEAKQQIIEEFNLQHVEVKFEIESHWEIGQGYEG